MRGGGSIGTTLLVLFAAAMVAGALQLGIILALIVGVFRHPRETFGLLFLLGFMSFLDRYPAAAVATLALLVALAFLPQRAEAKPTLLPPPPDQQR